MRPPLRYLWGFLFDDVGSSRRPLPGFRFSSLLHPDLATLKRDCLSFLHREPPSSLSLLVSSLFLFNFFLNGTG